MKKIIPISFLICMFSSTLLVGCGGSNGSESTSPSSKSSETSSQSKVDPPIYDEPSISIHYHIDNVSYDKRALWMWQKGGDGKEFTYNASDDWGAIAAYPFSKIGSDVLTNGMCLIDKELGSWSGQGPDLEVDLSKAMKDQNDVYHVWLKHNQNDTLFYEQPQIGFEVLSCYFVNTRRIMINVAEDATSYKIKRDDDVIAEGEFSSRLQSIDLSYDIDFSASYTAEIVFKREEHLVTTDVDMFYIYGSDAFNDKFYYDGELGALYTKTSTTFKVWSPFSSEVSLRLYNCGTPKSVDAVKGDDSYEEIPLTREDCGVWTTVINQDIEGMYYTYVVTNAKYNKAEVVDPYAKSAGVNGLRGMVVNFENTDPEGWESVVVKPYDRKELTVWETHVADVTSSQTWGGTASNAKKYAGMYETGTKFTKGGTTVTTGFDHIKELGVNAVQLLPIFDQANDEVNVTFNWGYNPLNYNVLEGAYSSDPFDGYCRIKEFKELIKAYNKEDINIIMDVVYNHVNSVSGQNFDVLAPDYYFRLDPTKKLYNGSGCGNETASDHKMFRKFMIDSTCFWAKEYKLGGFRFDLMGLHDLETMNLLTAELKKINPNIVVNGEPWTGGTSGLDSAKQCVSSNVNNFQGYGCFNDKMRDGLIKGGLSAATERGWAMDVNSSTTAIVDGIKGNLTSSWGEPDKTINYVTCHDNYCLYDRMKAAGITDETKIKRNSTLANAVVFTSEGLSFMLAGEECTRTKGGNSNSYNASYQVNEINYERKLNNLDTFENYKALIKFKQDTKALHYNKSEVASNVVVETMNDGMVIKTTLTEGNTHYLIVHVNGTLEGSVNFSTSGQVMFDTLGAYSGTVTSVSLKAYQSIAIKY